MMKNLERAYFQHNYLVKQCYIECLLLSSLKFWFKGQMSMIYRIHLILTNAYKLMCFDRNINGNRDVKFLECDYLLGNGL